MKKRWLLAAAALLCMWGTGTALAQAQPKEMTKPEMYAVFKEVVRPSMMKTYEREIKNMIEEFRNYRVDPEKVSFRCVFGPELGYVYVVPIENFASLDAMHVNWEEAIKKIGEDRFRQLSQRADQAVDHREAFHVMRRPELSYMPAEPMVEMDEVKYIHYTFYYLIPGKEQEVEKVAQEYVALAKKLDLKLGWSFYQARTGADLPMIGIAQPARSPSEFFAAYERDNAMMGEEGRRLDERAMSLVRRVERKEGWIRPDLSYPPPTN